MGALEIVVGIVLLVFSLFIVIAVSLQQGKDKSLSGTIAGGADTFFSNQKANTGDKILKIATPVVAVIFTLLVIVMYVLA